MQTYFSRIEQQCRCNGKHCDQSTLLDDAFLQKINNAREKCGFAWRVNSAYRCPDYNDEIGGYPNSFHTQGLAIDISAVDGRTKYAIVAACIDEGLSFGVYDNFIHIDGRSGEPLAFRGGK